MPSRGRDLLSSHVQRMRAAGAETVTEQTSQHCGSANPRDPNVRCNQEAGHPGSHVAFTPAEVGGSSRSWLNREAHLREFSTGMDAHRVDMSHVQQHEIDEWNEMFATPRKNRKVER